MIAAALGLALTLWLSSPGRPREALAAAATPTAEIGKLPPDAYRLGRWRNFLDATFAQNFPHGAMAGARRMLVVLPEIEAQETAYSSMIQLAEAGYPGSIRSLFLNSSLEPTAEGDFGQSFYCFKALANQESRLTKWADHYFQKVEPDKADVYQLYLAVRAYTVHDLPKARELLAKLLEGKNGPRNPFFVKQAARTLARIHFEEKNYEKSLEIYKTFLLKVAEPTASDWLEAAWNLFHLKRYTEALGNLYNLESAAAGEAIYLEKYILRGLIYHSLCDRRLVEALLRGFEAEFDRPLQAIRSGETLSRYPSLYRIVSPRNQRFSDLVQTLIGLKRELMRIRELPYNSQPLAGYVYRAEIALTEDKLRTIETPALDEAAEALMLAHEGIRFLGFEIAKSRYDPDKIFREDLPRGALEPLVEPDGVGTYRIIWRQPGDYWRDERPLFTAEVRSQCGN